jgi:endonuclease-3 related protein
MKLKPKELYMILLKKFGNRNWWPKDKKYHKIHGSDQRFEIMIGAILTQNTSWSNVEKALENLKSQKMLEIKKVAEVEIKNLQNLIKPSGFFNQKAMRLKNLALYLNSNYNADLNIFFKRELFDIRDELLSLNGIGPETADSILLYAGDFPIFVVDAYTKRICERIPLCADKSYDDVQQFFQRELCINNSKNETIQIYNEMHALIVEFAKTICKKNPVCIYCPIVNYCNYKKFYFKSSSNLSPITSAGISGNEIS